MTSATRKGRRRWLRRLLWCAAGLVVLAGLAVSGLWWRLHQGPIRIDFLQPRIEKALNDLVRPVSVKLGGTTLKWVGGGRPVEIQANDVRLLTPDGGELASFSEIGVGLYRPAFLKGKVTPTRLVFRRTHVTLRRNEDGSFELGLGDRAGAPSSGVTDVLHPWLAPSDPDSPLAQLGEISIIDSRLEVHDGMMGGDWGVAKVTGTLRRKDNELNVDASWVLDVGEYRSELTVTATYETSSKELRGALRFKDLVPSVFAKSYPGLEILTTFDDPLNGSIQATLADAVHLQGAEIDIDGKRGSISASLRDVSDDFSSFSGILDVEDLKPWLFADLLPELKDLSRVQLAVDAHLELQVAGERVKSLSFDVKGGKGKVTIHEVYPDPLSVESIAIAGSASDDFNAFDLSRISAVLSDVTLTGRASAEKHGDTYHGSVRAGIENAAIQEVRKYWPEAAAGEAREWVVDHVSVAAVSEIEIDMSVAVTLGDASEISIGELVTTFDFAGLSVDALRPQPAIADLAGSATMTRKRLDFDIAGGRAPGIEFGTSKVAITNLSGDAPVGLFLDLAISGRVESAGAMIAGPPLKLVPPDLFVGLQGLATGELKLEIPLEGELGRGSIHTTADVKLRDVRWMGSPVPLGNRELSDGVFDLNLDDDSLEVRGTVKLSGVATRVEYWENLTDGEPKRRVVAHAVIDDAERKAFDLPEQDYSSGAASLDMTYIGRRDDTSRIEAEIDLTKTALEIPEMGWTKEPGEEGHASGVFELTDESWMLDPFEIDAGGLKASGSLELTPDPTELRHLELDRVQLAHSDFHATLSVEPEGRYRLRVEGSEFDAVPLIDYLKTVHSEAAGQRRVGNAGPTRERSPFDIEIRLDELRIAEQSLLNDVIAVMVYDGDSVHKVDVRARMDPVVVDYPHADPEVKQAVEEKEATKLELSYLPKGGGHEFRFETDNLGVLVEGFPGATTIQGGTVRVSAARDSPDEPMNGEIAIENFTVLDLPVLAKILQIGSLRGMFEGLKTDGLWFKSVTATLTGHDLELEIADGKALGHGFGITLRGTMDLESDVVDLEGAVTPMETLQKVIGRIPLIGRLLAGWHREGIIAVLYKVKGPMNDVDVKVNHYSVLTPGITREIYRLAPDDEDSEDKKEGRKKKKKAPVDPN